MSLPESHLELLHDLALKAAGVAGAHIQSKVGRHRPANTKETGGESLASQVVTEVDLESQQLILEILGPSLDAYQLGLLTEESEDDSSRFESDAFWCIDPLDGTLPFTEGTAGYSVSIGLVSREGEPQVGVVHDPVSGTIHHAFRGHGASRDHQPIRPAPKGGETPLTWFMDRSMKQQENYPKIAEMIQRLAEESGYPGLDVIDHAGAALNGCWVATRAPAIYFKFPKAAKGGGSLWDFAASACVMTEWGRPPTDIHGKSIDLNRRGHTFMNERGMLYASSDALAEAVQAIYRSTPGD